MRGDSTLATILLVAGLSGCLSGGETFSQAPLLVGPQESGPLTVVTDARGCTSATTLFFVSFSETDPWLPPGFHPRDAADFLDGPVASDRGAVFVTQMDCPESVFQGAFSAGNVAIYIHPPHVQGQRAPSTHDLYVVSYFTEHPNLTSMLEQASWRVQKLGGGADATVLPNGGAVADVHVGSSTDAMFDAQIGAPADVELGKTVSRMWQQTEDGVGYFEFRFQSRMAVGGVECSVEPGSIIHRVVGATRCLPHDAAGVVYLDWKYDGIFHFVPGARAL